jgi:hypothetical protein
MGLLRRRRCLFCDGRHDETPFTIRHSVQGVLDHRWFSTLSFVAARYRTCMPQAWLADQVGLRGSYKRIQVVAQLRLYSL